MTVQFVLTDTGGTILLSGELDHHGALGMMRRINDLLTAYQPGDVTVDLEGLTFMDSSGLALLLGIYRRMTLAAGTSRIVAMSFCEPRS